jgi:Tol biopolymer transport system component
VSLIGQRIGPYLIESRLGAGGMGEVYRARDTRLGREVAVKVLSPAFLGDADRLARFAREARVLATLNHPHIGAIYGLEEGSVAGVDESTTVRALVLELVEGETLADCIGRGRLPVGEAVAIARQIAFALDAAHEKGIVHRDLKPANVKITPDGVVKVLDFGIAKTSAGERVSISGSQELTMGADETREGTILGTVEYMSPEQARGKPVDKRTDIWAFGCVLYEMLTGRPPFTRATPLDTLTAILEREPDWSLLPRDVPPVLRDVLRRCLTKDTKGRLRDIADAALDAASLAVEPTPAVAAPTAVSRRFLAVNLAWGLACLLLGAALFAAWSLRPQPPRAPEPKLFERLTDFVGMENSPAASPDGKTVAYVAAADGHRQIWLRHLAGGPPLQVTHDAVDHEQPRWAPDSSSLVYFTPTGAAAEQGTVWEIYAFGGEPRPLTRAVSGADVSRDGLHLAVVRARDQDLDLEVLTRDGNQVVRAVPLSDSSVVESVRFSPDGRWIAFQRTGISSFDDQIFVVSATEGEPVSVARDKDLDGLAWLPDSSGLVYSTSRGSTVLYPPIFNLRTVGRDGTGDRQLTFGDVLYSQPDVLASGALVATRTRVQADLWRVPVSGTPAENTRDAVRVTHQTSFAQAPSVSPDSSEIVYVSDGGGHGNLWIARADGSTRQITFDRDPAISIGAAAWSSRGSEIAFIVSKGSKSGLHLIRSDGSGRRSVVPDGVAPNWSGDDRWLYYTVAREGKQCIEKVLVASGEPTRVRCDDAWVPSRSRVGTALYYVRHSHQTDIGEPKPHGRQVDPEIRRADPEDGESVLLGVVSASRVQVQYRLFNPALSPDEGSLAMPLRDGDTTNLWLLPTAGGPMKAVTDFGSRSVLIVRRVSWSADGRFLYAAIADVDADVVMLHGLLPGE